jgi:hypothetical protein
LQDFTTVIVLGPCDDENHDEEDGGQRKECQIPKPNERNSANNQAAPDDETRELLSEVHVMTIPGWSDIH